MGLFETRTRTVFRHNTAGKSDHENLL